MKQGKLVLSDLNCLPSLFTFWETESCSGESRNRVFLTPAVTGGVCLRVEVLGSFVDRVFVVKNMCKVEVLGGRSGTSLLYFLV